MASLVTVPEVDATRKSMQDTGGKRQDILWSEEIFTVLGGDRMFIALRHRPRHGKFSRQLFSLVQTSG